MLPGFADGCCVWAFTFDAWCGVISGFGGFWEVSFAVWLFVMLVGYTVYILVFCVCSFVCLNCWFGFGWLLFWVFVVDGIFRFVLFDLWWLLVSSGLGGFWLDFCGDCGWACWWFWCGIIL